MASTVVAAGWRGDPVVYVVLGVGHYEPRSAGLGELVGREEECARLRAVLGEARRGMSGVLVLRGGPGSGKTSLLRYASTIAAGEFEVTRFEAVESEAELGFAALHHVLRPYLGHLDTLPSPQADALRQVFGLRERSAPPDAFLVGVAALGLLAARPGHLPLLCLVDDAHWLDRESARVLTFVARRLHADSTAMIFATRDHLDGLPVLDVEGLDPVAAARLVAASVAGVVAGDVQEKIVELAEGNPLALVEMARALTSEQLSGQVPIPEPVPVGARIFVGETRALPPDARALLLTAAADPTGSPSTLWRAGAALGFGASAAGPVEGLLAIGPRIGFRHPLIRSAVYHDASVADRIRVHAALAGVSDDPELRAWHLAAAATGPDDAVAAELERAGERAADRGGWTGAATLLARSAALSTDASARTRRLLTAAEAAVVGGSADMAQTLLDEADPGHQSRAYRIQARIHRLRGEPAAATASLLAADEHFRDTDVLVEALVQAQISGDLAPNRQRVAEAVRALPAGPAVTVGDLLLDADTALHLDGLHVAAPMLAGAVAAVRTAEPASAEWLAAACSHAALLGDDVSLHALAVRSDTEATRHGAVIAMALALSYAGLAELIAGRLTEAERLFDRWAALEEARGGDLPLGALLVAAWRGREIGPLAEAVTERAMRTGQGYQLGYRDYALGLADLAHGRYDAALPRLRFGFCLADAVEAAVRAGLPHTDLVERLELLAMTSKTPGLLGDLARARALTSGDGDLYREAVDHHRGARGPGRLARSHQVYGEWLRRERRIKEARVQLRAAHGLFAEMGAAGFAERTAHELSAAGDPVPVTPGDRPELTVQEARIARLAAGGATNPEIAAQLFVSVHTVDYHLRKIFRKLGVRNRRDLAGA
ncbi:AAA family ATPase [Herbidospora sp. RD11066]